jgi:hypothetical protein
MKTAGYVVAALLLGMALGSWGLKADLRKARKDVAKLQDQVNRTDRKQSRLDGITTMLNIPQGRESAPAQPSRAMDGRAAGHVEVGTNAHGVPRHHGPPWEDRHAAGTVVTNRNMREDIDAAVNVWKVRSQLARDGFLAQATSNDEQAARFDVLMVAMNLRLSNSIRTWVDYIQTEQTLTPETGVRMMNDLSGVMVQTYADVERDFPDWREKTEGKFNTMDFVDPQVALPLTEVESIMRTQRWDHAESFTNTPGDE